MSEATVLGGGVAEPFALGRALGSAISIFRQGFGSFLVLTGIAHIPMLMLALVVALVPQARSVGLFIEPVLQFLIAPIATATCLFGAYQVMRGRDFTISESLSVALSRFWSVIGVTLLGGLFSSLLTLLLIVPGIIYACTIFVALPACVIERTGPWASLRRSGALTKGYRWSILAFLALLGVGGAMLNTPATLLGALVAGPFLGALAKIAVDVLVGAFGAVLYAVVYRDLRTAKEGLDVEQLASVFD